MSATSSRKIVPPSACSSSPLRACSAPVKRAAGVAEQLAFGQRRAERGHVDGHERPLGAAAVAVDGPGRQLLAGAALAAQVDAGVGGRDQGDPLEHLLHGRRGADDRPCAARGGRRRRALGRPGRVLQRPPDGPLGHRQVERLGQVVEGPVADRADGRGQLAVGRHDDDRARGRPPRGSAAWPPAHPCPAGGRPARSRRAAAGGPLPGPARPRPRWPRVCPSSSASFASPQQMLCSSSTISQMGHGRISGFKAVARPTFHCNIFSAALGPFLARCRQTGHRLAQIQGWLDNGG